MAAYLRGADCGDCSNLSPCGCCATLVIDDNGGEEVDFSGTYYMDGTYADSWGIDWPKWVRTSPSTAYVYRDTWWVIAEELGEFDPGYVQNETSEEGDNCPTDTPEGFPEGIWFDSVRDLTVECA